jgi:hypothetical protein
MFENVSLELSYEVVSLSKAVKQASKSLLLVVLLGVWWSAVLLKEVFANLVGFFLFRPQMIKRLGDGKYEEVESQMYRVNHHLGPPLL